MSINGGSTKDIQYYASKVSKGRESLQLNMHANYQGMLPVQYAHLKLHLATEAGNICQIEI